MMARQLRLISPIPPSVNHYLGYRGVIKGGKPMAISYCTNEAKKYKSAFTQYVCDEVEKQGWDFDLDKNQHFYVDAIFYFPATNLDCNNYFKCMLDAITDSQKVWVDDNVTCERVQAIYYDSTNPRVELTIHPVDYIGIFSNADDLNRFITRCKTCTRFARNCSLLQKAKDGRIQPEINEGACIKYHKKMEIKDDENKKNQGEEC